MDVTDSEISAIHFPDDDAGADDEIVVDFANSYQLNMLIEPNGERWRVMRDGRTVYTRTTVNRDWHQKQPAMEKLWSGLADNTDLAKQWWSDRIESLSTLVTEHDDTAFLTPEARRILERTTDVTAYQTAEGLEFDVRMEPPMGIPDDDIRHLRFENDEILGDDPWPFMVQHHQKWGVRAEIGEEDWDVISRAWDDAKELIRAETETEDKMVAERVINHLSRRVQSRVTTDSDEFLAGDMTVYYESDDQSPFDGATVWVKSETLQDVLESQTDKTKTGYLGTLSKTLRREEDTYDGSSRKSVDGTRVRCYPFKPETLGIDKTDSLDDDDEDGENTPDEGMINEV